MGIVSTQDAIARAKEQGLQLVEVNSKSNPPVCKILDYGKFKYETAKREREGKKGKKPQEMKEVKFRPKIGAHDFNFKLKHARRFLTEGNKVRLLVQFRGREVVHPETGRAVLDRVCKDTEDLAMVVQIPKMEGNRMAMIIGPRPGRGGGGGGGGGGGSTAPAKPNEDGDAKAAAPKAADKAAAAPPKADTAAAKPAAAAPASAPAEKKAEDRKSVV